MVGVDISSAAIAAARTQIQNSQPHFQVLDATHTDDTQALHKNIGDANVYMRGSFHQIQSEDRSAIVQSLQTLLGEQGQLFLIELSPKLSKH